MFARGVNRQFSSLLKGKLAELIPKKQEQLKRIKKDLGEKVLLASLRKSARSPSVASSEA